MVTTCPVCHTVSSVIGLNGSPKRWTCSGCRAQYEVCITQVAPPVNLKMRLQGERYEEAAV
jgi:transcription elongation factor Elf1